MLKFQLKDALFASLSAMVVALLTFLVGYLMTGVSPFISILLFNGFSGLVLYFVVKIMKLSNE